jgi:uncharacterized protein (TIGR03083 family)
MPLQAPLPIDTRRMFRPVSASLVTLLRGLSPEQWLAPTVAGTWAVRDVVAHLLDSTLRRLSFHRDGMAPPRPPGPIESARGFVGFINDLNAQWVSTARRLSPRVLTDLYERASVEAADWFESLPFDAPALFPVSWAGEQVSNGWFDVAREFTELWHHQQQVRMAVGAAALADPHYLGAVIDVAMRGLPHAFREVDVAPGRSLAIEVSGPSGGQWALSSDGSAWRLNRGAPSPASARIRLADDTAWKLLFHALTDAEAARLVEVQGPAALGKAFLRARSVIV